MDIELFYNLIKNAVQKNGRGEYFLPHLDEIHNSDVSDEVQMTQMTIFFEGLYRETAEKFLYKKFVQIRMHRWENHYGVPTIAFLKTFYAEIEETHQWLTNSLSLSLYLINHG